MEKVTLKLERKTGEDRTFIFPVLPEKLEISGESGNESIDTIRQGEVTVIGDRKLRRFDIESFFTANEAAPFCRTKGADYRPPEECVRYIKALQAAKEPVSFIAEGLDMDAFWVTIEAFRWTYDSTRDIGYTLSFKEYRPFGQRAKTLDVAPDIFGTGERREYESSGQKREPTGWAIGDRATVSGMYYSSPNGQKAMLGDMADMPERYMAKPWTAALEDTYRALSNRITPLKSQKCVIIDIWKTQENGKSAYGYCVADISTKQRIGWVAAEQMERI